MTQRESDELYTSLLAQDEQRRSIRRPLPPLPDPPRGTPVPAKPEHEWTEEQQRRLDDLFR